MKESWCGPPWSPGTWALAVHLPPPLASQACIQKCCRKSGEGAGAGAAAGAAAAAEKGDGEGNVSSNTPLILTDPV